MTTLRYISDFNRIICELAPRFVAADSVPVFLPHTPAAFLRGLVTGDGLKVWAGASDATIYGDARVNHAFRAWHDACHLRGGLGFTLEAERAACAMQERELLTRYPGALPIAAMLRAEIIGQAEHFAAFGEFPTDQAAFIAAYMEGERA